MRLHAPAAERNALPILEVLRERFPSSGLVLEVASGTGQHVATFAAAMPGLRFAPSDRDADALRSIGAWTEGMDNVAPAVQLDVSSARWPVGTVDAVFCANMIHIAPEEVVGGLMRGASEHVAPGGVLALYGPFRVGGQHTAPSNAAFDASLRSRDPSWGVRDLESVEAMGRAAGFDLEHVQEMPANNKLVFFRRTARAERPE
ncbi:MAG: DUF938 domain-containing protein [Nannocystales bacterium]